MRYIPNTEQDRRQMLDAIGAGSVDKLVRGRAGRLAAASGR